MSPHSPDTKWIVLLAHGSADARWREPFETLRERIARAGSRRVALAYLQFSSPTLEETLRECRDAGAREVLVVPAFMSGGGHLLRDVPRTIARAAATVGLRVRTAGALVEEPEVLEGMVQAVLRLADAAP